MQQHGTGREVVIVEAVRTPIGRGHKEKGYFKDTHPNELLGKCYTEVIERAGIDAGAVEDVITGCVQQYGEQMFNVGRNAWLQAGLSVQSDAKAHRATAEGRVEGEIIPFQVNADTCVTDQGIRPGTTRETLAGLKPAFKEDGRVTAGNASQISDGAAAVLLMSAD